MIEALVALALLAALVQGIISFFGFMHTSDRSSQQRMEMRDLMVSLRELLKDKYQCTQNLQGLIYPANTFSSPTSVPPPAFRYFDKSSGGTEPLASVGVSFRSESNQGITPTQFELRYRAKFPSLQKYVADLEIVAEKDSQSPTASPTAPLVNRIALMVTLDGSGRIKECYADPFTAGDLSTRQMSCALVPQQGLFRYDPGKNQCVKNCFSDNNAYTAACPGGSAVQLCSYQAANPSSGSFPPRQYMGPGGATTTQAPPIPNVFPALSGNGCACTWRAPGPAPGDACIACCSVSNLDGVTSGNRVPDPTPP